MTPHERARVVEHLETSHFRVVDLTASLTSAQWHFRESPDRWSIAENIEHLVHFEHFILNIILSHIERPTEPGKKDLTASKNALIFSLADTRDIRFNAREIARPTGRWPDPADLVMELRLTRETTLAFASETQADLCGHFFPHIAWGDLDCYQWLLLLGQHSLRHALQIEQVMADPAYPVS